MHRAHHHEEDGRHQELDGKKFIQKNPMKKVKNPKHSSNSKLGKNSKLAETLKKIN